MATQRPFRMYVFTVRNLNQDEAKQLEQYLSQHEHWNWTFDELEVTP
jgi:hypothetical protein